ncbi:MAG: competence/damage-inducible protein A, partial [Candidatus Puniceispirillaceae bacterium]
CAIGEGTIAGVMEEISTRFDGVSVGSYPWFKPGQFGTAVVLTGLDIKIVKEAANALTAQVEAQGFTARMDADNSIFAAPVAP